MGNSQNLVFPVGVPYRILASIFVSPHCRGLPYVYICIYIYGTYTDSKVLGFTCNTWLLQFCELYLLALGYSIRDFRQRSMEALK